MTDDEARSVKLPSGERVARLGQGTWRFGEDRSRRAEEEAALRLGIDLGMTLIDTAEMYANGGSEQVVGAAIAGQRDRVFLVSKVLPTHATRRGTVTACEASLRRLGTDVLDLYLLHWPGSVPIAETVEAFDRLRTAGKIRHWGVSNLGVEEMEEVIAVPGGDRVATDQVLYNLRRRGIEWRLLPWCRERGVPIMAYSPVDQGRLASTRRLQELAARRGITAARLALAWVLRHPDVFAIPAARNPEHVRDNRAALDLELDERELAELDRAFPRPPMQARLELW